MTSQNKSILATDRTAFIGNIFAPYFLDNYKEGYKNCQLQYTSTNEVYWRLHKIDLFRKEMSYAQNSQHGASKISRGKSVKDWLYASSSCKGRGLLYHARIKLNVFNIGEKYSYN
jgi:hypothetical protein